MERSPPGPWMARTIEGLCVPAEHRHVRGIEIQIGEAVDVGEARGPRHAGYRRLLVVLVHPRHRRPIRHVAAARSSIARVAGRASRKRASSAPWRSRMRASIKTSMRGHLGINLSRPHAVSKRSAELGSARPIVMAPYSDILSQALGQSAAVGPVQIPRPRPPGCGRRQLLQPRLEPACAPAPVSETITPVLASRRAIPRLGAARGMLRCLLRGTSALPPKTACSPPAHARLVAGRS